MTKFCSLFSGSSGNCTFVEGENGGILIDAGGSLRKIATTLQALGTDITHIRAIFLTHEHIDHIKALPMLFKKWKIPVFATPGTVAGVCDRFSELERSQFQQLDTNATAEIAGMSITSFATSHDSKESVGFHLCLPNHEQIAVATDLGFVDDAVRDSLCGCRVVMLESNHDIEMLKKGRYPVFLKRRILSAVGHLSNRDCASLLPDLVDSGTEHIVLAHLSKDNNSPRLALQTAQKVLDQAGSLSHHISIEAAPRSDHGQVYTL
ncbi:MAG TPA: MBL fold metallo-hydrolase [Ruminococcaceae bacterium]|nr:MBL fold metallo-hydrolase [Oscillospiraceae bacterium]